MTATSSSLTPEALLSAIARNPPIAEIDTTVLAAIAMMGKTGSNYVLVVDSNSENKGLVGILTERDIVRIITQPVPLDQLPIQAVMSHPVITLKESRFTDINAVLNLFQHHRIRHLPLLDDGDRIVGLLDHDTLIKMASINDRKQTEAALQQLNQDLEKEASLQQLNQDLERRVEKRTAALQQSQLRASEAQQIAHLGDWTLDILNQKLIWSTELFRIFGLDPNQPEPTYVELLQYYPPDERKRVIDIVDRAIHYGEPFEVDLRIIRADGSSGYTFAKAEPIWDAAGQVIGLFGVTMDISDRKAIQEALKRSEERARATLLALPDLVFRVNRDGQYMDFLTSPQGKNLVDPYQSVGKSIYEALSATILPDHAETKYAALQRALATQTVQTYEQQVWTEDKLRYEEVRVAPCNNDEVVFFVRDISDRKQAEKSLLESQQFIQTVVDTVPLPLFWKNRESIYLGCNQQDANVLGLSSTTEIIGKTDFDLSLSEAEAISYRTDDQDIMTSGEARLGIEETITLPNGEQRWIETQKAPLRDSINNVIGIVGMWQDVTDRRQTEARLKHQAEQERLLGGIIQRMRSSLNLAKILNSTVEEVHQILKSDRVLVYRIFPNGTGVSIAESVLPNWPKILDMIFPEEVFPQENYDRYLQGRIYTLSDREDPTQFVLPCLAEFLAEIQVRAELVVPIIQNQTLWGLLIAHQCDCPRHWQDWEINLLQQTANQLAIAIQQANLFEQLQQELTERLSAEARLTETNAQLAIFNQELARATQLKDEFLANMSHELRTPLNSILGMTEVLQEGVFGTVNEGQIKALQTVERSGTHLLEVINDILDVAKIESGQIELEYTSTSVSHLCQSSLAFIKQQTLQKRIQLNIKLQPNLPDILIDERRIRQVLINLLNNAVKFTPEGGSIILEVSQPSPNLVPTDPPPQYFLLIAVIDTGIGIAPENIQKLFHPFIQIDSALNRQYTGTGLGLTLVKQIVELHGGKVKLTSELGVGSCFAIELPYTSGSPLPSAITAGDKLDSPSVSEAQSHPPLILIADDNEANVSTMSSYLKAKGYGILVAQNGLEAIAHAKSHQPDLILMDIQMPGIDGLEATRQIRQNPELADIPIIALTALAMTGDREKCLAAGVNDYLTKPVKLKQLATTIQQLLVRKEDPN